METDSFSVFISYASPDRNRVLPFFDRLKDQKINVWMDCKKIKAGQDWNFEIQRAMDKASLVVMFISQNSVDRRGYVQREQKQFLDKRLERLHEDIYIIPVTLDDEIAIPQQLQDIQSIQASDPLCYDRIIESINHQIDTIGGQIKRVQEIENIRWISIPDGEEYDGIPGYEFKVSLINFTSGKYQRMSEIGHYIRGHFLRRLFNERMIKFDQNSSIFNFGQEKYRRTNTYDAHHGDPVVKGKIVTIPYSIHWYAAGAAHPNSYMETFSFLLDPMILIKSLGDVFLDPQISLTRIQDLVRSELRQTLITPDSEHPNGKSNLQSINEGTKDWDDFHAFIFNEKSITVIFPPYQVAAYAYGFQFSDIPYEALAPLIRPEYRSALGIDHLMYQRPA